MNWDDLRILIAVRDEGSYARAGKALGVNETTIARRLARLEAHMGLKLFAAIDGKRQPTAQCRAVLEHANEMARQVAVIASITPDRAGITGHVRIAMTQLVADEVLAPRVTAFLHDNPNLTLQFLTSGQNVSFSRWEADLAIRLRRPAKGDFIISRLATIQHYYFEPVHLRHDLNKPVVCRYPDDLDSTPESEFLDRRGVRSDARLITESLATIRQILQSRTAAGILPEYACKTLLKDKELDATLLPQNRTAWLLIQAHLKGDQATRLVIDWIRGAFRQALS